MKTRRIVVNAVSAAAIIVACLLPAGRSDAWDQCFGKISAMVSEVDDSLIVVVDNPNCGCKDSHLFQPPSDANHKATHANVLAAFLAGLTVSFSYEYDSATPCFNCGYCRLHNVSLVQ